LLTQRRCSAVSDVVIEAIVGEDGELRVDAAELAAHGVRPGDHVQVLPAVHRRHIRSMLGAHARPVGFDEEHLRELRHEMGGGTGGDLTR
jgi:hypothetical protein